MWFIKRQAPSEKTQPQQSKITASENGQTHRSRVDFWFNYASKK